MSLSSEKNANINRDQLIAPKSRSECNDRFCKDFEQVYRCYTFKAYKVFLYYGSSEEYEQYHRKEKDCVHVGE